MWRRIFRLFRRSTTHHPPLADDWVPGDVAECIRDDWRHGPAKRPRVGGQAMVLRVAAGHSSAGELGHGLELLGFAGRWDATAFRKVPPASRVAVRQAWHAAPVN